MAGRILNFDRVIVETVTVAINGGPTWKLRDDVPARTLAQAFHVFELERRMAQASADNGPTLPLDEEMRLLDEREEATLDVVTAIVQHSYPEVPREDVASALAPSARTEVLRVFFPLLLRRFGKPSPSSPGETPETQETAKESKQAPAQPAAGPDATRSRKR